MIWMDIVLLTIGTILVLVFIYFLNKGAKYEYMMESLGGDDFPLSEVYGAGMAMQDIPLFKLSGKLAKVLRDNTKLYYGRKFSEYYSHVIWAQTLSIGLLCMAVCFVISGFFNGMEVIFALLGVVMAVLPGYVFIHNLCDRIKVRQEACEQGFPNAISKLALIVNSGVILHDAWEMVAYGNDGVFYTMMQRSCEDMKNGQSDIDAIMNFGFLTNSDEIKKFTSAMTQSIERGGGELSKFLSNQSKELWAHHRQFMLQKGEKAASALLMPIVMMFAGVMMIVIVSAMQTFTM